VKSNAVAVAFGLCLAVVGSVGSTATAARADGCTPAGGLYTCGATVTLTLIPTQAVVGQTIVGIVNVGSYSCQPAGFRFHFSATTGTYPSLTTVDLGWWPGSFRTSILSVGTWRISGYTAGCYVQQSGNSVQLVTNEAVVTVKPKPAVAPPRAQAPPKITATSPPPPLVIPTVRIETLKLAPRLVDFHSAAMNPIPPESTLPSGALVALVLAAAVIAAIGLVRRRRSEPPK
jgi:hypothetical protein